MRARLTSTRASAVRPANARQMWSSILTILRTVRASCSLADAFFSTPARGSGGGGGGAAAAFAWCGGGAAGGRLGAERGAKPMRARQGM